MSNIKNLISEYKEGNKDKINELLNIYYPYVINRSNIYNLHKTDYEDFYSAGLLGLVKALNTCNLTYDERIVDTYIKKVIAREIFRTSTISKSGEFKNENYKKIYIKYLSIKEKTELTDEKIADRMNISYEKLKFALETFYKSTSLSSLEDNKKELYLIDDIVDKVSNKELVNLIGKLCKNDLERKILFLRYGLYDGKCYTLAQIGKYLNVKPQRVIQILDSIYTFARKNLYNLNDQDIYNMFSSDVLEKTKISYLDDINLNYNGTIYDTFNKYDKDDVKYVVDHLLNYRERKIIYSVYGKDFKNKCLKSKAVYYIMPLIEDKLIEEYLSKTTSYCIIFNRRELDKALIKLKHNSVRIYSTLFKWLNEELKKDKDIDTIYADLSIEIFNVKNKCYEYSKKIR